MTAAEKDTVLLVDDDDTDRYGKSRVLRRAGFEVIEATNGTEALRALVEYSPRLAILDVRLPDIDGWEICRRIKSDPATACVLVLQMSATFVTEADTVRALEGGADACLTEPVEPPVLVATVRALLRARQAEDELREALAREQLAREAAEAANRTKDDFLATLSHELRSPLGAILTWVTLLRAGKVEPGRVAHALEAIDRNVRLQTALIEELLDVSRIISGKMVLEVVPVDVPAVVDAALESVRTAADAKGVALLPTVDRTMAPIAGDATRLQQVVWNLLSNAVKFTPLGGWVDIRVEHVDGGTRITVTDTGQGIDPGFLPHIFERFRQADASTTRAEGGLGLGLAIVRHVVEMHGGTVCAQSAGLDRGATFTVELPAPTARESVRGMPRVPRDGADEPETLAGVRILVVDDEPDAREAIAALLEHSGARPSTAGSVPEALRLFDEGSFDAVVSDIAMPGDDGYALVRALRRRAPARGRDVPVIALTAHAGVETETRAHEAGFHAHLCKPIETAVLIATLARLTRSVPPA